MSELTTDVLIIGAGPAGLCTAIGLAQRGIDFLILDALPEAQNTSRAAVIHAATLDSLGQLGVAERLINQGIKARETRIRNRDQVLFQTDFSSLPSPTPYALMIPQDETEAILLEHLQSLGGNTMRPARLTGYERTDTGIQATIRSGDQDILIDARFLIGTDGQDSTVRTAAGIGFPGDSYGSFLLADVRMDWPISQEEVSLFVSGDGIMVVAPMSDGRYRIVAQYENAPLQPHIADVQRLIDLRGPATRVTIHDLLWGSRFRVHHKLADHFRDGPVLLAGDAAHVHSPAGGQGMNLGIRDALALSDALAQVIGGASGTVLDSYASDRRAAAQKVLAMTDRLTMIATLTNPAGRLIRDRLLRLTSRSSRVRRSIALRLAGYD
ncbi:FAD-dependent monooxygenase [Paracoccus caeni]|uniref:FAD-dependent monooxygenase n=1 Tax=Paracoccus caeni TaxID=657651 RepID=A0A934SAG6_9RHOB|nr:FAD-dependent oxidoreductase [Paracoccus caeni]MBK4214377.1 FAD-dependent monooxygenase [Paracoccus caeni]